MEQSIIEGFRLSPQQKHLWLLQQQTDGPLPFSAQCAILIEGELNRVALDKALKMVVARHEIFRTTFRRLPGMTIPLQVIGEDGFTGARSFDLSSLDGRRLEAGMDALSSQLREIDFDFEHGPLFNAATIALGQQNHLLVITLPALCADSVTLRNMVYEIGHCYEASVSGEEFPGEHIQYADFAEWQNELCEAEDTKRGSEYWHQIELPPSFSATRLPSENQADSKAAFKRAVLARTLGRDLAEKIKASAQGQGATTGSFLLACWQVLLWRLTGESDIVIGLASDGRKHETLKTAMGLYASHLPFLSRKEILSFAELVRKTEERAQELYKWQEYFTPEQLKGAGPGTGDFSNMPFCFEFEGPCASVRVAGLRFSGYRQHTCIERCKVKLICAQQGERLVVELHYDSGLFESAAIERLWERLHKLLESASDRMETAVDELEILPDSEREELLVRFNDTKTHYPEGDCIQGLFEEQAKRTPHDTALIFGDRRFNYAELNAQSNQLAHHLQRHGAGPEKRVAIYLERSAEMIIGLLGVLKAGAAYIPLDSALPQQRLATMLNDAQPLMVLTTASLRQNLPADTRNIFCFDTDSNLIAQEMESNPVSRAVPENLAYIIYTSGSTGSPKGVAVEHRNLVNYVNAILRRLDIPAHASFAMVSTFAADLGHTAVFPTLCTGGSLHLLTHEQSSDPEAMAEYFKHNRIDCLKIVPSHFSALLKSCNAKRLLPARRLVLGGEASTHKLISQIQELRGDCLIFNHYGPTETTVGVAVYSVDFDETQATEGSFLPVGRPLANVQLYLLDHYLRPVPMGVAGELYIGGKGVTRGYLNRPDLTADRFIPDDFSHEPGARLYRTGDRARHLPDGNMEFLGRVDRQVKVRGFRVELAEIEAALGEHPAVRQSVVVLREDANGNKSLAAYLTAQGKGGKEVEGRVRYKLPNGMRIAHQNKTETDYMYEEIFEQQVYLKHGIDLPQDACVFDVGANIGLFTLFASERCPQGIIYAFEPIAATFNALRLNTDLYGTNIKLFQVGLSEAEKTALFTFYPRSSMMSGLSAYADAADDTQAIKKQMDNERRAGLDSPVSELLEHGDEIFEEKFKSETHECHLRRLSDLILEERVGLIDLLKVDVQRAELDVLNGLGQEDWSKIRQVVMEVHDEEDHAGRSRLALITELLGNRGFDVVTEQAESFKGTGRYNLYAKRYRDGRDKAEAGNGRKAALDEAPSYVEEVSSEELRRFLADKLPEYMIPSTFTLLEELPLTPNGKIDYAALPQPAPAHDMAQDSNLNPTEELLSAIWEELLGVEHADAHANFFELGGHSLLAAQVVSRLQKLFQVTVPLHLLFEAPTIAGLARGIEALLGDKSSLAMPPLVPAPRTEKMALSFAQQRLWFLDQLEPESPLYNVHLALSLKGALNIAALEQTFNEVIRRHEILRTTFRTGEEPSQLIASHMSLKLTLTDLRQLPQREREAECQRLMAQEARRPFNLSSGPLMRASLLRSDDEHYILLLTMHHIVADGWSLGVLAREVAILYQALSKGELAPLAELPVQYADFAIWQRNWLAGETVEKHLDYWRRELASLSVLKLPADKPLPAARTSRGATMSLIIPEALIDSLKAMSRREGATLFITLLAAFQALLHYYSEQDDIVVGTDVASRNPAETEALIGFFVNQLVLRTDLSGNPSFRELIKRTREVFLNAYAHQDIPFDKLVEALRPDRTLSRTPLFQAKLVLQNAPMRSLQLPGIDIETINMREGTHTAKFDLLLTFTEAEGALVGSLEYSTDLFSEARMESFSDNFISLLHALEAQPDARLSTLNVFNETLMKQRAVEKKGSTVQKLTNFKSIKPQAISLSQAKTVRTRHFEPGQALPLLIEPDMHNVDLAGWVKNNRQFIQEELLKYGGLLFRGFDVYSEAAFHKFLEATASPLMQYIEGATPRTLLKDKIYTSTEYPADQSIALHNELTYVPSWPMKIWFCCVQPAREQGETPIADVRKVLHRLSDKVRERFMDKGWMLVRNFGNGLSLPWQSSFHTDSKAEVEAYCRRAGIEFAWKDGERLRTFQRRAAIATHPQTNEMVWFNHVAFWHISSLEPNLRESMLSILKEEDLAYNTYYGDGSPIEDSVVEEIREAYRRETVSFPWERGDILMLDNMLVAHGRNPFAGERKILVAMGDAYNRSTPLLPPS